MICLKNASLFFLLLVLPTSFSLDELLFVCSCFSSFYVVRHTQTHVHHRTLFNPVWTPISHGRPLPRTTRQEPSASSGETKMGGEWSKLASATLMSSKQSKVNTTLSATRTRPHVGCRPYINSSLSSAIPGQLPRCTAAARRETKTNVQR